MDDSHILNIKLIKQSKSIDTLYGFMMTTAIIQGILPLVQMIYTALRFKPLTVEQREIFKQQSKYDV